VAVIREVRRLDAAGDRLPAVEEEDFHGLVSGQLSVVSGLSLCMHSN
jgi:hypothetical protein